MINPTLIDRRHISWIRKISITYNNTDDIDNITDKNGLKYTRLSIENLDYGINKNKSIKNIMTANFISNNNIFDGFTQLQNQISNADKKGYMLFKILDKIDQARSVVLPVIDLPVDGDKCKKCLKPIEIKN